MPDPHRLKENISQGTVENIVPVMDSIYLLEQRLVRYGVVPEGSHINAFVFDGESVARIDTPERRATGIQYLHPAIMDGENGVVVAGTQLFVPRPADIVLLTQLRVRWSNPTPLSNNLELAGTKIYPRMSPHHRLTLDDSVFRIEHTYQGSSNDSFWVGFKTRPELFEWLRTSVETCGESVAAAFFNNLTLAAGRPERSLAGRPLLYRATKQIGAGEAGTLHTIVNEVFTNGKMEELFRPLRVQIDRELDGLKEISSLTRDLVRVEAALVFLRIGSLEDLGLNEEIRQEAINAFEGIKTRIVTVARNVPEKREENEAAIQRAMEYLEAHIGDFDPKKIAQLRKEMKKSAK